MPNRLLLACLLASPLALALPAFAQGAATAPASDATVEDAAPAKATRKARREARRAAGASAKARASEALVLAGGDAAATAGRDNLDALISMHAKAHKLPEKFVHAVIKRESNYNPRAIGRGGVYGLMQIKHGTARGVGYEGPASGLLDPKTNLAYGVAYLAGAYRTAGGDEAQAYRYFNRGYYYAAKRKGVSAEVAALDESAPVAPQAGGGLTGAIDKVFGRRIAPATVTASADPEAPVVPAANASAPALRGTMAAAEEPARAPAVVDEATFKSVKTEAEMAVVMAALEALPLPPRRPAALRVAARRTTVVPKTALVTESKPDPGPTASR